MEVEPGMEVEPSAMERTATIPPSSGNYRQYLDWDDFFIAAAFVVRKWDVSLCSINWAI